MLYTSTPDFFLSSFSGLSRCARASASLLTHTDRLTISCAESPAYNGQPIDKGESQSSSDIDFDLPPLTSTTARKLQAKVDWHILPCLCILYLLAFLDR